MRGYQKCRFRRVPVRRWGRTRKSGPSIAQTTILSTATALAVAAGGTRRPRTCAAPTALFKHVPVYLGKAFKMAVAPLRALSALRALGAGAATSAAQRAKAGRRSVPALSLPARFHSNTSDTAAGARASVRPHRAGPFTTVAIAAAAAVALVSAYPEEARAWLQRHRPGSNGRIVPHAECASNSLLGDEGSLLHCQ